MMPRRSIMRTARARSLSRAESRRRRVSRGAPTRRPAQKPNWSPAMPPAAAAAKVGSRARSPAATKPPAVIIRIEAGKGRARQDRNVVAASSHSPYWGTSPSSQAVILAAFPIAGWQGRLRPRRSRFPPTRRDRGRFRPGAAGGLFLRAVAAWPIHPDGAGRCSRICRYSPRSSSPAPPDCDARGRPSRPPWSQSARRRTASPRRPAGKPIPDRGVAATGSASAQLLDSASDAVQRHRHHAVVENPADQAGGFGIVPMGFGRGVDPEVVRPLHAGAHQPDLARLFVPVFVRPAGLQDFIGTHRRIAHEDAFVIGTIGAQHIRGGGLGVPAAGVVAPHAFVQAVVEIERHQMLEFGAGGAEEFLHDADIGVHAAAHVEKQQHFYSVAAFRAGLHIQPAMIGGGADGAIEVQFVRRPVARPFPQAAQRNLDVAGAEFLLVIQIAEFALVPDLDRALVAALVLADPHAFGVVAISAKGRGACGADPFIAALMAALLFGKPL